MFERNDPLTRRAVLGGAAAIAAGAPVASSFLRSASAQSAGPKQGGFVIGCQAYSFNRYSAWEAIEKTAQAGGTVIEFYPGQKLGGELTGALDQNTSDDAIAKVKEKLAQHSVQAVAFGVVGLGKDEAGNRKVFDFARKMGLRTITSEPDPAGMDNIEKLVKEYDIRVAIHNHPKRSGYDYWSPEYVLGLIKNRDKRIGSCADTGHWVRSGIKPIDAIKILKGRVLSSHFKDLNTFSPNGYDVPYGKGVSDIAAVLAELQKQKFDGHLAVEYEHDWETSVPLIAQSIGFVRCWNVLHS